MHGCGRQPADLQPRGRGGARNDHAQRERLVHVHAPANYCGPDSFTFRANDGTANSNTATYSITVTCVNDAPVCANDSGTTNEDTPLNDSVVCTDADANTLTYSVVSSTLNGGTLNFNPNGSFTYNPATNYFGPASFTFKANDGTADSNTATYTITVTEVNDAPSADDDTRGPVAEDGSLVFPAAGLVLNDSKGPANESGQTLTVTAVTATLDTHGTVSLTAGDVTYTPAADYNGPASFEYTLTDDGTTNGAADPKTATGTVNVTVTEVNDAPSADDDTRGPVAEDGSLVFPAAGLVLNDSKGPANESGQTLTVTAVTATPDTHGTVSLATGDVTYTPAADFNGAGQLRATRSPTTAPPTAPPIRRPRHGHRQLHRHRGQRRPVGDDDTREHGGRGRRAGVPSADLVPTTARARRTSPGRR